MAPNPGHLPPEAAGRRVHVILRDGYDTRQREPAGWPADGARGCNWRIRNFRADILEWELVL
ncbi:MAG: hypothetical protein KGJ57_17610 [Sphingomonadales bacterium]|nr:hypothetical protein [Sphingomonadales bacterium]MDE2171216.1 hypothetical protein [Sphingomonadales bacterium]